jgi:diguanylate cyclase
VQSLQEQVSAAQREIDRLRADLERTREESMLDPLTQVLNRRGFDRQVQTLLQQPPADGQVHCLVMIDIDHFKRVNDLHGHPVGDRVLAGMGAVLRTMPQEPGMTCARYGGEEFAILLPSTTLQQARQLAESVRTRVHGIRLRDRQTQAVAVSVTVSAGVAAWRRGDDADAWVSCADAALYRSKAGGRDRVMVD